MNECYKENRTEPCCKKWLGVGKRVPLNQLDKEVLSEEVIFELRPENLKEPTM